MIPSHPAHEQCLENYPAESKAEDILEDHLGSPGAAEDAGAAPARMPTPSPATQCIVDPSVCRQRAAT